MMIIEEWKKLYEILDRQYSEFLKYYPQIDNGKNQQIRKAASARVTNCIDLCCTWILRYRDAYELLTGENSDDYTRFINWDEFELPRYFRNDMPEFLENVQIRIKSLEEGE